MERAEGMMPVASSSGGSRTSIRIIFGFEEGEEGSCLGKAEFICWLSGIL